MRRGGYVSHFLERLPYGSQPGRDELGKMDVIHSHD